MQAVDMHIHIGDAGSWFPGSFEAMLPEERRRFEVVQGAEGKMRPEALLSLLDESGVEYAVVIGPWGSQRDNEYVADFCRGQERLLPFFYVNPHVQLNPAGEIKEWADKYRIRGLKMLPTYHHYYPNDNRLYPVYAVAAELGLPITIHTGSSTLPGTRLKYGAPIFLDDVAVDFPELKILLAHCGRGLWYDQAALLARLHRHIYLEISGLPPARLPHYFDDLERLADKMVFGSDWPTAPAGIQHNIAEVLRLPISEEAKAKILRENALRILKFFC